VPALGPYASFILAAYAAAIAIVVSLIGWIIADYRAQKRALHDMEAKGISRRSSARGQ
jgi:heme exporter protein D